MAKEKKAEMAMPLNMWYRTRVHLDNSVEVIVKYILHDAAFDKEAKRGKVKFKFTKDELDSSQATLIKSELLSQSGQGFYRPNMAGAVANVLYQRERKLRYDFALAARGIYSSQLSPRLKVENASEMFMEYPWQKQLMGVARLVALRKRLMTLDTLSQIKTMEPIIDYYMGTSIYYA
ncbi:hypothetical protein IKF92_00665 [Candidatus Saccharibacteria bacterium]|nr:hypothetical protein [Candidatus Saccharibacteria bacterium]